MYNTCFREMCPVFDPGYLWAVLSPCLRLTRRRVAGKRPADTSSKSHGWEAGNVPGSWSLPGGWGWMWELRVFQADRFWRFQVVHQGCPDRRVRCLLPHWFQYHTLIICKMLLFLPWRNLNPEIHWNNYPGIHWSFQNLAGDGGGKSPRDCDGIPCNLLITDVEDENCSLTSCKLCKESYVKRKVSKNCSLVLRARLQRPGTWIYWDGQKVRSVRESIQ